MNPLLRRQIVAAIRLKSDTEFQDFIDTLFSLAHESQFTSLKQKKDKGCDGILNGEIILAAYGPEKYSLPSFKTKIDSDYRSYSGNWKPTHPKWMVVTNCELLANMVQYIESKHTGAFTLGVNEIASKIEALPWSKIRRIGEFLGIPSELLMNDLLGQVIDDLIRMDENGYATTQRPHALYIEDKIVLNYAPAEVKLAIEQYSECLEYFNATQLILQGHTTMEISSLRARITRDFAALGGTFSQRISGLVARYCEKAPNDDLYRFGTVVVLTFFFEQCLIGARTSGEVPC